MVTPIQDAISALRKSGIDAQHEDLHKLLPSDPMEATLGIVASMRGYFQGTNYTPLLNGSMTPCATDSYLLIPVAYKRFVDMIPTAIDHEAIRRLVISLSAMDCSSLHRTRTKGVLPC